MTTDDDERRQLAERLRDLSLPELVDVLRHVLPRHDDEGESGYLARRIVLAKATIVGEGTPFHSEDPAVLIAPIGWPDSDFYQGRLGPTPHLFESGPCFRCGLDITSNVKQAFCPICGEHCSLT